MRTYSGSGWHRGIAVAPSAWDRTVFAARVFPAGRAKRSRRTSRTGGCSPRRVPTRPQRAGRVRARRRKLWHKPRAWACTTYRLHRSGSLPLSLRPLRRGARARCSPCSNGGCAGVRSKQSRLAGPSQRGRRHPHLGSVKLLTESSGLDRFGPGLTCDGTESAPSRRGHAHRATEELGAPCSAHFVGREAAHSTVAACRTFLCAIFAASTSWAVTLMERQAAHRLG
jgi:hypothetical protein